MWRLFTRSSKSCALKVKAGFDTPPPHCHRPSKVRAPSARQFLILNKQGAWLLFFPLVELIQAGQTSTDWFHVDAIRVDEFCLNEFCQTGCSVFGHSRRTLCRSGCSRDSATGVSRLEPLLQRDRSVTMKTSRNPRRSTVNPRFCSGERISTTIKLRVENTGPRAITFAAFGCTRHTPLVFWRRTCAPEITCDRDNCV